MGNILNREMIATSTEEQRVTDTALQGSLSISLTANDLQRSLQFYEGLGFIIDQRYETDGKLQGVMLKAGNASLGVSQDDFAKGRDRVKGVGMSFYVETDQDIAALAARAKQAGVKLERDAAPLPWGPMGFAATDPDGFKITILNRS
jgi:catechol 2,3-dioxygenase-like lactoylglutathione lyase family enzyme